MALSATVLRGLIRSKMLAAGEPLNAQDSDALTAMCQAIAEAVVEHVTAAGVVNVTTVTACPAGAGTGSGTGSIT